MKKTWSFVVLAGLAMLAIVLIAACGNGTTEGLGNNDDPLVYSDVVDGKVVEITISRTDPARAVLTPRAGDYYEIKYDGVVVSKGRVTKVENGGQATFTPAADSPGGTAEFTGTFATGSLSIPSIPIAGGRTLESIDAAPDDEDTVTLDELLHKYMAPQPTPWDNEGTYWTYWLDPASFEAFKAALDAAGEYKQDGGGWTEIIENREAHHVGLAFVQWRELPDGGFGLYLFKEDDSMDGYKYARNPEVPETQMDELLRTYMAPEPLYQLEEGGIKYFYYLDPARFENFKAELDAGGEYSQTESLTDENRDNDLGLNFARWIVGPGSKFHLVHYKADNSVEGYDYKKSAR